MFKKKIQELITKPNSLRQYGLMVMRRPDGTVHGNVEHVRHSSVSGYDLGGGAPGADLALSVLHALIPAPTEDEEQQQFSLEAAQLDAALANPAKWTHKIGPDNVRVTDLAYKLHQPFRRQFLANLGPDFGFIPVATIVVWINRQRSKMLIGQSH